MMSGIRMKTSQRWFPLVLGLSLAVCDDDNNGDNPSESDDASAEGGEAGDDGPGCPEAVEGNYANCMTDDPSANGTDVSVCGSENAVCVTDRPRHPSAGVCAVDACESACDCPAPPPTGNAPVVCDEVTEGAGRQCHMDCAEGQICPEGMFCYGGYICAWPSFDGGVPYGDCVNEGEDVCGPTQLCRADDDESPTFGVCARLGCDDVSNCPEAPGSGNAVLTCAPLVHGQPNACYLDCSRGETCPSGMVCFDDLNCAWQAGSPGGGGADDGDDDGGEE
jgi:hypothetical protein